MSQKKIKNKKHTLACTAEMKSRKYLYIWKKKTSVNTFSIQQPDQIVDYRTTHSGNIIDFEATSFE